MGVVPVASAPWGPPSSLRVPLSFEHRPFIGETSFLSGGDGPPGGLPRPGPPDDTTGGGEAR
eukprot:10297213-Lingulodinium_polyedra.AAC.1